MSPVKRMRHDPLGNEEEGGGEGGNPL